MIEFRTEYLEGFGSYITETKFKLNRPGLNIIIAENGSGKTTTFSGLYWTLYGKTLKDTKSVETRTKFRPDGYKGTKTQVKFKKEDKVYQIIRCKNYTGQVLGAKGGNRLVIIEDGTDITKRDKRGSEGIQAQINNILGYSPELFLNSIIFGQRLKRLIQESGPNKKKVFEEAFEASFINGARKKAEEDYKAVKEETQNILRQITTLTERIIHQKKLMLSEKANFESKVEKWGADIEYWQKRADDLGVHVSQLENKISKAIDITSELEALKKKLKTLFSKSNLKQLEDDEFRTKNQIDREEYLLEQHQLKLRAEKIALTKVIKNCPRCGGKLDLEKIAQEKGKIKAEIINWRKSVADARAQLNETQARYKVLIEAIASNKSNKDKIRLLEERVKRLETDSINQRAAVKTISQKRVEMEEAKDKYHQCQIDLGMVDNSAYTKAKTELRNSRKQLTEAKLQYKPLKKKHDDLQWLVNDALSNKGIKTYIFDTMLKQLNNQLKYYTQFIGMRAEFAIDFDSANKDLYAMVYDADGDMAPYEDLSGGEAQLIDVVTAFALHDITTAGRPCNLMVLDEVFEGLDEGNVDIILDLIQDKAKDKCLFLISHNSAMHNSSTKVIKMHRNKQGQTILKLLQP